MSTKQKAIPFVLKDKYLSVTVKGQPYSFAEAHPSFKPIKEALEAGKFKEASKLIITSKMVSAQSAGKAKVDRGVVTFNGEPIDTRLSKKILELVHAGQSVGHLLKFMENVHKNPWKEAPAELYTFLEQRNMPITDDGCFVAYKVVKSNYTDCHTGTISNRIGQIVLFPRSSADPNRRNECSYGLHFCALNYARNFSGDKVMAIKINPEDVVSIPYSEGGKGRCVKYEVIYELGGYKDVRVEGHRLIEKNLVLPVAKERKELLKAVLAHPVVKKMIKAKKIKVTTLQKSTFGRLQKVMEKAGGTEPQAEAALSQLFINPLKSAREAANLSVKQIASQLNWSEKKISQLEDEDDPNQIDIDAYLVGIENLRKQGSTTRTAVSFPVPVQV